MFAPTAHCETRFFGKKPFLMLRLKQSNPFTRKSTHDKGEDFWESVEQDLATTDEWRDKEPTFLSSLKNILDDPSEFLRNVGNGMKLGLAAYSVVLVWKLYTEISKALESDQPFGSTSDVNSNRVLIEALVGLIEERGASDIPLPTKLSEDGRSLLWISLIQKLHASGMTLRSDDPKEPSIVKILPSLTKTEVSILHQCLIDPRTVDSSERMFGLDWELDSLDNMIHQMKKETTSKFSALFGPGNKPFSWPAVLLYGPPGCGKSMLIRHSAAKAQVPCLTLTPSLLLKKFVGESNLQVRALFTLISKLSPCILFIDEIDGLFRERSSDEHHVSREIKTEFLQYWDGLSSEKSVLVVGATNRPFDLDSAVLRRLPQSWFIDPPHASVRKELWNHWLSQVPVEDNIDVDKLVAMSERYTHSDIRHVLQVAALEGPLSSKADKISFEGIVQAISFVPGSRLSDLYSRQLWSFIHKHDESLMKRSIEAWETPDGRFYSLGTLNIDADAIRIIMDIVKELQDADSADDDRDDDDDL